MRNKKNEKINIKVTDQIPVSSNSEIEVDIEEVSSGRLDTQSGKVAWDLQLSPNEQKELTLRYRVKYPKHKRLIIN